MEENKIAFIVGAGAVENAWDPVLRAFKEISGLDFDTDSANCFFARSIYLMRFYSKLPKAKQDLEIEITNTRILKNAICREIKKAQELGILKPRKEFREVLDKFVQNNKFGFISTNWDTVITEDVNELARQLHKEEARASNCFHIHGSIEFPDSIYLPSETMLEDYRSDEENNKLGVNHNLTIQFLLKANQILLYGLSLDPLDAELSQVLNGVFSSSKVLQEIIVINPDYKKVKNRVSILLTRRDISIRCFSPKNLDREL